MSELPPDEPSILAAGADPGRRDAHKTRAAKAQTRVGTPEQRHADVVAAQEFNQIKKFAAACRRQWPGAAGRRGRQSRDPRQVLRATEIRLSLLAFGPIGTTLNKVVLVQS
jgi:hypothetical protein